MKFTKISITLFSILSFNVMAGNVCSNESTIFYAKTANQKKEVSICEGSETVTYFFAKTDRTQENGELTLTLDKSMVQADRMHGAGYHVDEISIPNGDVTYVISTGDGADGQFSDLIVNKSGKQIASIKMDNKSMINNIEDYWIKNN